MNRIETIAEGITLHLGDCREILPTLPKVDACITDPPYGIDYSAIQPGAIKYDKIVGDAEIFNPNHLMVTGRETILWGANNFMKTLPRGGWIVWDKRCCEAADRVIGSPFELAWCSRATVYKMIRIQHGAFKNADAANGDVANEPRFHPTQKPFRLYMRCIEFLNAPKVILDPYMGVGGCGIAAVKLGRKFIGIEIEQKYFDIACRRISEALKQPDLFIEKPKPAKQEALFT